MLKKTDEKAPAKTTSQISAPRFAIINVPIRNAPGAPLVVHAFSAKARQIMREAQELGSVGKKRKPKDPSGGRDRDSDPEPRIDQAETTRRRHRPCARAAGDIPVDSTARDRRGA